MSSAGTVPGTGNVHDVPYVRLQHYAQTQIHQGRRRVGSKLLKRQTIYMTSLLDKHRNDVVVYKQYITILVHCD